ncbi:tetratricopeptide repeat protein [Salmonella enterica]
MKELSEFNKKLEDEIVFVVESGNVHHDNKKLNESLGDYLKAWSLIPEPKIEWNISNWVASCLYSVYFDLNNLAMAKEWGEMALKTRVSGIDTSPLIDLGMVCYELNQFDEAIHYFDQAYKYGGVRAFQGRPKKYLNFYLSEKK